MNPRIRARQSAPIRPSRLVSLIQVIEQVREEVDDIKDDVRVIKKM